MGVTTRASRRSALDASPPPASDAVLTNHDLVAHILARSGNPNARATGSVFRQDAGLGSRRDASGREFASQLAFVTADGRPAARLNAERDESPPELQEPRVTTCSGATPTRTAYCAHVATTQTDQDDRNACHKTCAALLASDHPALTVGVNDLTLVEHVFRSRPPPRALQLWLDRNSDVPPTGLLKCRLLTLAGTRSIDTLVVVICARDARDADVDRVAATVNTLVDSYWRHVPHGRLEVNTRGSNLLTAVWPVETRQPPIDRDALRRAVVQFFRSNTEYMTVFCHVDRPT